MDLHDLDYELPADRIAERPLDDRSASRLLVADGASGRIEHRRFRDLVDLLPAQALLIVNDTRVIQARLPVRKSTGGAAEVFCLAPVQPVKDPGLALLVQGTAVWDCLVGGKNIRAGDVLIQSESGVELRCEILEKRDAEATVQMTWAPDGLSFANVAEKLGKIPLPPYIRREADEADRIRYQTVYAEAAGSVAAPTAGLHFTDEVFAALRARGVETCHVTLHVGAGTFKPIQTATIDEHSMHAERVQVSAGMIQQLREALRAGRRIVSVGTTSTRTVESLYWLGVRILRGEAAGLSPEFSIDQWADRKLGAGGALPTGEEALSVIQSEMSRLGMNTLAGETRLMIAPGYRFAIIDGLITNFHQPRSTLLLLVSALVGVDLWKRMYREALDQGYRFLSYGDSSLLWKKQS